jgi:hypothetical protein
MSETLFLRRLSLLLLCLLALGVAPCMAQSGKKPQPRPGTIQPGPELIAELDEHDPEVWQRFTSAEGQFSILFPGVPEDKALAQEAKAGKITGHQYQLISTMALYQVIFANLPVRIDTPEKTKILLDGMRNDALDSDPGKLLSESDMTIEGYPGRYIVWRTDKGVTYKVRYIIASNRVYSLLFGVPENVDSGRPDESPEQTQRFMETVATKFFDSFKISSLPK